MKKSFYLPGLLVAGSVLLFSCEKTDLAAEELQDLTKKKTEDCELISFRNNNNQYVFQKQLDGSGKLRQLTAGIYQGGTITSTVTLDAHWSAGSLALLKAGTTTDTVLFVTLNAQGKPTRVSMGNTPDPGYLPTTFEYTNNRISAYKVELAGQIRTSRFQYDKKDNCTGITDDAIGSEIPGRIEYAYSNSKADGQAYFDEPRTFSMNTLSVMQFAGLLPELQPNRLRTGVKVFWQNNYKVYDAQLVNHQVTNGKLMKYEVSYPGSNITVPYYAEWACGGLN